MKYHISHTTTYRYSEPVSLGHNEARLTPRSRFGRQQCLAHQLLIRPTPATVHGWTDYFGNAVSYFTVEEPHGELAITAESEVDVLEPAAVPSASTPAWEQVRGTLAAGQDADSLEALQFTLESTYTRDQDALHGYSAISFGQGRPLLSAVLDLTDRIHREFKYDPAATSVNTPIMEVFRHRRGVCQDFAHLEIACLRSMGLTARYVSGYLLTDPPPGQRRLIGVDGSHAWLSVFCPGAGWLDIDPTNNLMPSLRHVTVAWGRDYGDVCPVKGIVLGGGGHTMRVAVDMVPVAGANG
ncbi:MAG: transglutaminase family protein [Thermoguttaceae bacterium]